METNVYINRRRRLRDQVSDGAILILGSRDASRNYVDNVYPFRQDSHFLYFTGISHADMALVIEADGREVLYGAPPHPDDLVWHGPHPVLADHAEAAGVAHHEAMAGLGERLRELSAGGERVHWLPPYRGDRMIQLADLLGISCHQVGEEVSSELVRAIVDMRAVKSGAEVAEIEEALAISAAMYKAAWETAAAGRTEAEVAAALLGPVTVADRQTSFPPIVTVRGEVLHNTSYANTLGDGDLLLIDSGAESKLGYASDITRTVPVSGRYSGPQRDIYEVVLDAQLRSIEAAAPGVNNRQVHLVAARSIASGLKDLGLMKGDVEQAVASGAHALFFPHGIGHMMGLDVHDMEDLGDAVGYPVGEPRATQFGLGFLRLARPLEPGWVITVEPGIYFVPALIDRWKAESRHAEFIDYQVVERYREFGGIRIEDDVLITDAGRRVLGPGIPKTADEVEAALG